MTYEQTLEYLFQQLPMYQRVGKAAYKADLKTTEDLMEVLNHPYRDFPSIHLAGTNGKGSTAHMLASMLQEEGYRVGLYTSPHLKDFRERIKINGEMIPQDKVVHFVELNRKSFEALQLSFFEWTVGLAFSYFKDEKVDIAVIETGMGGRLDSTNVITPLVSIITNIGLDHTRFLGDTIEKIAAEKAGIIKAEIPVVLGKMNEQAQKVIRSRAEELNSACIDSSERDLPTYPSDLLGSYQQENQKTALAAISLLGQTGFPVSKDGIEQGLRRVSQNTGLMGRWQKLSEAPLTICDTAHNTHGLIPVMDQVSRLDVKTKHFVIGMVDDKNVEDALGLFPKDAQYYFCQPSIPRALNEKILVEKAHQLGLNGNSWGSVKNAWKAAQEAAQSEDLIYIGGSTFVVAEVVE
ncbi:bifunctional folylpolyglutamate synthase/dihydrofolate synthase [bacterium SCSIO 12741]|nr:bifunctional folylpolyglutamate synthase/dihydrofolate synthase [bacterium SCSIO 12741]